MKSLSFTGELSSQSEELQNSFKLNLLSIHAIKIAQHGHIAFASSPGEYAYRQPNCGNVTETKQAGKCVTVIIVHFLTDSSNNRMEAGNWVEKLFQFTQWKLITASENQSTELTLPVRDS